MTLFSLGKIFSSNTPAPLLPVTPTHIYSITMVYSGDSRIKLTYNTDVRRLQDKQGYQSVFEINRSDVFINSKPASNALAGDLAAKCGSVIYPLQLQIGETGELLKVWNYTDIVQRWQVQEKDLLQYFTGEEAAAYIANTAATIHDPVLFLQSIRQDLFLTVYFHLLYSGYRKEQLVAYPLQPFAPALPFRITHQRALRGSTPDTIHQHGTTEGGSLEIKATFTETRAFLRLIEGRWDYSRDGLSKEVAIRVVCIAGEDEPIKQASNG